MNPNPSEYLAACEVIDFDDPQVLELSRQLAADDELTTARQCFLFVRDEIRHSSDFQLNPVTLSASEVLKNRTGYCYAKSHLLCALLRANGIPCGLAYQRLSIGGDGPPYCLHGLNAVYLTDFGWYRIDARGNRTDVDAQFCPPNERLAFQTVDPNEANLPGIHAKPLSEVIGCLTRHDTWDAVLADLPDVSC
ncbi:MAG: transglutaminase family protein [Rubripirellula sp.]